MTHPTRIHTALTLGAVTMCCMMASTSCSLGAEACFCLENGDAIARGCTDELKGPNDAFPTASCKDPTTGKVSPVLVTSEWKKLLDGNPGCTSCAQIQLPRIFERPR